MRILFFEIDDLIFEVFDERLVIRAGLIARDVELFAESLIFGFEIFDARERCQFGITKRIGHLTNPLFL